MTEATKKQEEMDQNKDDKDKVAALKKERDDLLHEMDDLKKKMEPPCLKKKTGFAKRAGEGAHV